MYHKWISNDNGKDCYRCGTSVDLPFMPFSEENSTISSPWENDQMENEIMFFVPNCAGPSEGVGHHWYTLGPDKDDAEHLISAIECHYCMTRIGFDTDLAYVPRYCLGER